MRACDYLHNQFAKLRVGCNVLLAEHRQRPEGLASQRGPETLCKPGPEVAGVFCAAGQVDFARKKAEARPRSVN
jgi:hypothetical protein